VTSRLGINKKYEMLAAALLQEVHDTSFRTDTGLLAAMITEVHSTTPHREAREVHGIVSSFACHISGTWLKRTF